MFVQVITATVADADAARALHDRWEREVRPGAAGFLGGTFGLTGDGRVAAVARFDTAAAARANSERPEQGAWWAEMARCLRGPEFHDSEDVDVLLGGPSADAGFVQVIRGRILDPAGLDAIRADLAGVEALLKEHRPDIVGELAAVHGDGTFTEVVWFEPVAAPRAAAPAAPPPLLAFVERWSAVVAPDDYYDLTDPWTS
jgi:hypothetical protein